MNENQLMENKPEEETVSVEVEEAQSTSVPVEAEVDASEEQTSTIVQEDDSGELENYSENVQKRINQLTAKRKQAIEEAEAAYTYAQQAQVENAELKQRIAQLDQGYINEYGGRVESQSQAAQRMLQEAYDAGDMGKVAEAQKIIAKLAIEEERIRIQKSRQERQAAADQAQQAQQPQQIQQAQQPQQEIDSKLKNWMGKNAWFGTDMFMTRGAQSIHEILVAQEGYDTSSDEYYAEIDRRMRQEMPHKFQGKRQNAQTVAPASNGRSSVKSGRKKTVELTPGQVAFATKMKIPLERYVQEVAKLERKAT